VTTEETAVVAARINLLAAQLRELANWLERIRNAVCA